jgi:hypothetical protein
MIMTPIAPDVLESDSKSGLQQTDLRYTAMALFTSLEQTASVTVKLQRKRGEARVGSLRRSRRNCIAIRDHDDGDFTYRLLIDSTVDNHDRQQ